MEFVDWQDGSVIEAASWRLASEIVRRHPKITRLIRAFPGGGQYDVLWILPAHDDDGIDIRLNRNGTIQVHDRYDGRPVEWEPVTWDRYLRADPREFLHRLETAAGLPVPAHVPASQPWTLTCRILAEIAATAVKSVHPIEIQSGMIDTSGYGGGPNGALELFTAIPEELLRPQPEEPFGHSGYRFWILLRDDVPILAFEQDRGLAFTQHHNVGFDVMALYEQSRRHLLVTTMKLLRKVDHV